MRAEPLVQSSLLVVLLGVVSTITTGGRLGPLPLNTTGSSTTVGRLQGVVDVLLRVETDDERWDVDELLADSDVALTDKNTGVVDRLGESDVSGVRGGLRLYHSPKLEDLGLQPPLQKVLGLEGQDVIETHAGVVEHTDSHETTDQSVTLEETLGVLVVELEELTGSTTDLGLGRGKFGWWKVAHFGKGELDTPDLTLVSESILSGELGLVVVLKVSHVLSQRKPPSKPPKLPAIFRQSARSPSKTISPRPSMPVKKTSTHLELGVETGSLVGPLGNLVGLGLLSWRRSHLDVSQRSPCGS